MLFFLTMRALLQHTEEKIKMRMKTSPIRPGLLQGRAGEFIFRLTEGSGKDRGFQKQSIISFVRDSKTSGTRGNRAPLN